MTGVLRGLTRNRAETDPASEDQRLRGRTYAIPFEAVWSASVRIAREGMRRWSVISADDQAGTITIEAQTLVWKAVDDILIRIRLDENAQTRVDVTSSSRSGKAAWGRNARSIASFLKRLDRALDVRPGQILDPTTVVDWRASA